MIELHQREEEEFVYIEVDDEENNVEQLRFALNMNGNDNDEETVIFSENRVVEVTADQNNQTIENLCSSSFLDQVKSDDGAHNSSIDSDIIGISNSRGGLSGISSNLSGLINDSDDTNHDGEKGTKKEVTSDDHDSSLLSYQSESCGCFNVSMDDVSFFSASTQP